MPHTWPKRHVPGAAAPHPKPAPKSPAPEPASAVPAPPEGTELSTVEIPMMAPAPFANPYGGPQAEQVKKRPRALVWLIGAMIALQFLAPAVGAPELAPTRVIGSIMVGFTQQISAVSVENQLLVARGQRLADSIAEMEAEYADKRGKCGVVGIFGREFGSGCNQLVDQYYVPALRKARADLASIHRRLGRR